MTIPDDLLDSLMKDYKNPEDLIGGNRAAETTDQATAGASDADRDDGTSRLREKRSIDQ